MSIMIRCIHPVRSCCSGPQTQSTLIIALTGVPTTFPGELRAPLAAATWDHCLPPANGCDLKSQPARLDSKQTPSTEWLLRYMGEKLPGIEPEKPARATPFAL